MKYSIEMFSDFPDEMNKEQLCQMCHIAKRTALWLIKGKLIPCRSSGKKTRCYSIKKSDVVIFLNEREKNPSKFLPPEKWYSQSGAACIPKPAEPDGISLASARSYYTRLLRNTKDVVDVKFVSELTGYTVHTVRGWITDRKLRAFALPGVYAVPKEYLINFLSSKAYNSIRRKSRKHIETLWSIKENDK